MTTKLIRLTAGLLFHDGLQYIIFSFQTLNTPSRLQAAQPGFATEQIGVLYVTAE